MNNTTGFFDKLIAQLFKFGSVGILITLVSVILYYLLLQLWQLPLYPVYITVYAIAVVCSYLLNAKFTFKEKRNVKDGVKYGIVYIGGLLIGLFLLSLIKHHLDFNNFISVLISIPPRVLLTFVFVKLLVFRN